MVDFAEFKKFFLFNLIGSLAVSAIVAVVTVLIGEFNEITFKVLLTLLMVIIHSIISLMFIWDDEKQNTFDRLGFFINVLFVLIVLSFFTSIFGIWGIVSGEIIWHLYQTYFIIAFAALHGDILSKALGREDYLNAIVFSNYFFMIVVVSMLLLTVYVDNAAQVLGDFFFRVLGAVGIIDGTLSIMAIIFYKIYMHKHPRTDDALQGSFPGQSVSKAEKRRGLSIWVLLLIGYLFIQIVFPLIFFGIKFFSGTH